MVKELWLAPFLLNFILNALARVVDKKNKIKLIRITKEHKSLLKMILTVYLQDVKEAKKIIRIIKKVWLSIFTFDKYRGSIQK